MEDRDVIEIIYSIKATSPLPYWIVNIFDRRLARKERESVREGLSQILKADDGLWDVVESAVKRLRYGYNPRKILARIHAYYHRLEEYRKEITKPGICMKQAPKNPFK